MSAAQSNEASEKHMIKAVRVSCNGERRAGVPAMRQCDVSSDHEMFRTGDISEVSRLVGIPFHVYKVGYGLHASISSNSTTMSTIDKWWNLDAGCLMHELDAEHFTLSQEGVVPFKTPQRWSGNVGSVLIARTDQKPLWPHHLRTLMRYMREIDDIARLFVPYDARGPLAVRMLVVGKTLPSAEDIRAHITPGEFKEYYMAQCQLKMKLRYPTLWSFTPKEFKVSERRIMQWKYWISHTKDKYASTESWKERMLLNKIRDLQKRLDESEKLGAIQRKRCRTENTSNDDIEQAAKRQRLEEGETNGLHGRKRRRSQTESDEDNDRGAKKARNEALVDQVIIGRDR